MDYVPAHGDTNRLDDRDEISGARVFDGEDQGKSLNSISSVPFILIKSRLTQT